MIGASGGIGAALVRALEKRGLTVTGLSRQRHGFDLRDPDSVEAVMGAQTGPFDMILVATGVLAGEGLGPEKRLRDVTASAMAEQFAVNCIGPAMILKHAARLLPRDRRAVFACLSARVGSIGENQLGGWYSYRASKAALNQVLHTGAIELVRSHPEALCGAGKGRAGSECRESFVGAARAWAGRHWRVLQLGRGGFAVVGSGSVATKTQSVESGL